MSKFIPLSVPNFEGNERKYVDNAIDEGWVSTGGAYITQLEKNMAEYLKCEDVCACQSGTSAIHLSLIDIGVGANDMVIVPTLTFIAAVNPVMYQHAEPVFMDCDDSLCIDPVKIRRFCEEECELKQGQSSEKVLIHKKTGKQVKAIVAVHVFGNMADMEAIMEIAAEFNLKVIEDATEALGTYYTSGTYAGKYAGTIGDYGAYSFNGNKIITTGGGGAATAKSKEAVAHMRYLSTQAKDDPHYYIHDEIGYNYRMTNVQAAIGVAQLEELEEFVIRKNKNYDLYNKLIEKHNKDLKNDSDTPYLMEFRENTRSNKWFYALKVAASIRMLIEVLEKEKIQTRAIWGLIHEQKPYSGFIAYDIEKAKYYRDHIINLPCSTNLSEKDISFVTEKLFEVLKTVQ